MSDNLGAIAAVTKALINILPYSQESSRNADDPDYVVWWDGIGHEEAAIAAPFMAREIVKVIEPALRGQFEALLHTSLMSLRHRALTAEHELKEFKKQMVELADDMASGGPTELKWQLTIKRLRSQTHET